MCVAVMVVEVGCVGRRNNNAKKHTRVSRHGHDQDRTTHTKPAGIMHDIGVVRLPGLCCLLTCRYMLMYISCDVALRLRGLACVTLLLCSVLLLLLKSRRLRLSNMMQVDVIFSSTGSGSWDDTN